MVEFMNDLINYPVGRGGKLEYFLDRFHLQADPEDDHTLMITAKSGEYKITDVSCIAGSPISNAGALEKAPAGNLGTAAKGLILPIGANAGQTMEISIDRLEAAIPAVIMIKYCLSLFCISCRTLILQEIALGPVFHLIHGLICKIYHLSVILLIFRIKHITA